jgi:tetratricopeptide (TPR) repeat protein
VCSSDLLFLRFRRKFIIITTGIISIFTILVGFRNYEWRDAFSLWKAAVKVQPRSAIALHNLAAEYLERGEFTEAERLFKKSLSLSNSIQTQVRGRINLAYILERQGKLTEAEAVLKETERISDKDFSLYQFLGRAYLKMGKEKEAEGAWKRGLVLNPFAAEIQIYLGQLYLHQGKLKEAKEYFQASIKSNPDLFLAYFNLGQVFEQESDIESAVKTYEKSVRLNPAYAFSQYALGTLYAKGLNRRALRHLREAVRLFPDFAEAHNNLAILYASMEPAQLELAREHAKKAIELGYPVNKEFLRLLSLSED